MIRNDVDVLSSVLSLRVKTEFQKSCGSRDDQSRRQPIIHGGEGNLRIDMVVMVLVTSEERRRKVKDGLVANNQRGAEAFANESSRR